MKRTAVFGMVICVGGLTSCVKAESASVSSLVPSGFYWLPKEYEKTDLVYLRSKECGRATRDISVAVHQTPPPGFSILIFRPAAGSSPKQVECIVSALGGKVHMMMDVPGYTMRPAQEPAN